MNPNITKIIDQYLAGELSSEDNQAFETKLDQNEELRQEVEIQQLVIEGAKRAGQRMEIKKVKRLYHLNKLLKWGAISMSVFVVALIASYSFFNSFQNEDTAVSNDIVIAQNDFNDDMTNLNHDGNQWNGERENKGFPVSFDSENVIESAIPTGFLVPKSRYYINPKRDTVLKIGSDGTSLFIPKYAFVDRNGNKVKSLVEIKYQEYRNSADIAFSGIPMVYKNGETEYMFNSSGMFSIFGFSNGKPVEVSKNKTMKIDYKLVRKNEGTDFYVLDEDSTNWKFLSDIEKEVIEAPANCPPSSNENNMTQEDVVANHGNLIADTLEGQPVWVDGNNEELVEARDIKIRHRLAKLRGPRDGDAVNWEVAEGMQEGQPRNGKQGTLLAAGADAGHTYPDIVKGLNVGRFGVYNCDQIYRLGNRITVSASYKDQNGKSISDGKVLSMIDLNYTGAFSFDPKSFTCNAKSDNVLLLFTRSGKMYMLDKGEFKSLNVKGGRNTFTLKEVTNTIKSTKDLEAHLEL